MIDEQVEKSKEHGEPKDTRLHEAYYKRYGVYFTRESFARIKKIADWITLSLRDIYSTIKSKMK